MFIIQALVTAIFVLIGIYILGPINPPPVRTAFDQATATVVDTTHPVALIPPTATIPPEAVPAVVDEKQAAYMNECVRYGYDKVQCERIWTGPPSDEQQVAAATPHLVFTHKHNQDALGEFVKKVTTDGEK